MNIEYLLLEPGKHAVPMFFFIHCAYLFVLELTFLSGKWRLLFKMIQRNNFHYIDICENSKATQSKTYIIQFPEYFRKKEVIEVLAHKSEKGN